MRARNVARTNRFLNARLRTIGLDTDALDEQMREQRAREMREEVSLVACLRRPNFAACFRARTYQYLVFCGRVYHPPLEESLVNASRWVVGVVNHSWTRLVS